MHEPGVIIIATNENMDRFFAYLSRKGIDPEHCRREGQLIVRNAEAALRTFMRGDLPDWSEFRRVMGAIIESLQTRTVRTNVTDSHQPRVLAS